MTGHSAAPASISIHRCQFAAWIAQYGLTGAETDRIRVNKRLAVDLHLAFLAFQTFFLPYTFAMSPTYRSPAFLPYRIYLVATLLISVFSVMLYTKRKSYLPLYGSLATFGLLLPFVSWACDVCGGIFDPGFPSVLTWSFIGTLLVLVLGTRKQALFCMVITLFTPMVISLTTSFQSGPCAAHPARSLVEIASRFIEVALPIFVGFLILLRINTVMSFCEESAELKHELSQRLLECVLPTSITGLLQQQLLVYPTKIRIVHRHPNVTVGFSDIVGFTSASLRIDPDLLVSTLNDVFALFDGLCIEHGIEKIKTIGDAYMVAGFPITDTPEGHEWAAQSVIGAMIKMLEIAFHFILDNQRLTLRAGVHSGPVVAGVIGCTRFCYDLWGPTVNLASRLESSGIANTIQMSTQTKELIECRYKCLFRGAIQLKGIGMQDCFLLDWPGETSTDPRPTLPRAETAVGSSCASPSSDVLSVDGAGVNGRILSQMSPFSSMSSPSSAGGLEGVAQVARRHEVARRSLFASEIQTGFGSPVEGRGGSRTFNPCCCLGPLLGKLVGKKNIGKIENAASMSNVQISVQNLASIYPNAASSSSVNNPTVGTDEETFSLRMRTGGIGGVNASTSTWSLAPPPPFHQPSCAEMTNVGLQSCDEKENLSMGSTGLSPATQDSSSFDRSRSLNPLVPPQAASAVACAATKPNMRLPLISPQIAKLQHHSSSESHDDGFPSPSTTQDNLLGIMTSAVSPSFSTSPAPPFVVPTGLTLPKEEVLDSSARLSNPTPTSAPHRLPPIGSPHEPRDSVEDNISTIHSVPHFPPHCGCCRASSFSSYPIATAAFNPFPSSASAGGPYQHQPLPHLPPPHHHQPQPYHSNHAHRRTTTVTTIPSSPLSPTTAPDRRSSASIGGALAAATSLISPRNSMSSGPFSDKGSSRSIVYASNSNNDPQALNSQSPPHSNSDLTRVTTKSSSNGASGLAGVIVPPLQPYQVVPLANRSSFRHLHVRNQSMCGSPTSPLRCQSIVDTVETMDSPPPQPHHHHHQKRNDSFASPRAGGGGGLGPLRSPPQHGSRTREWSTDDSSFAVGSGSLWTPGGTNPGALSSPLSPSTEVTTTLTVNTATNTTLVRKFSSTSSNFPSL